MTLFSNLDKFKKKIAFVETNGNYLSYSKLVDDIISLEKTIFSGPIVLLTNNSYFSLLIYIYAIRNKLLIILLDSKTNAEDLFVVIKKYKPTFVVIPTSLDISKYFKNFNIVYSNNSYCIYNFYKNKDIKTNINLLLPTSGSMSKSKFVKLTNENLKSNTDSIIKYLKINSKEISITNMPSSYSYMLSVINTHISSGASMVISNYGILQREFWKVLKEFKVSNFNGVPYIYEIILKIGIEKLVTGYINNLTQAGGKLDKNKILEILNFCDKNKIKCTIMYGQTEASPRISYLEHKLINKKPGSIGKVIPNGKLWLVDKKGNIVKKPYTEGELVYKGKNVFHGYSNSVNDLKKSKFHNDILFTGDIGTYDEENFFYITSRKNRITKIFGYRINLDDLEYELYKKNFKVVCIGNKNIITIFSENYKNEINVIKTCAKLTKLNPKSFKFVHLKNFPRTTSDKINFKTLEKYND